MTLKSGPEHFGVPPEVFADMRGAVLKRAGLSAQTRPELEQTLIENPGLRLFALGRAARGLESAPVEAPAKRPRGAAKTPRRTPGKGVG